MINGEKKEPAGLLFMLAMVISGALTSSIYFYYLFDNWTVPCGVFRRIIYPREYDAPDWSYLRDPS